MSPKEHDVPAGREWRWELAAVFIAMVGVAVRCIPWPYIFSDGDVVLVGTDPYYHLWRAWNLVENFPSLPCFDPFISFPVGAPVPWPPGFDLMLALPGLLGADSTALAGWGAFLMPLLGGLAVYLTYRVGRTLFDPACGLVAAVFMALMFGGIEYSMLGRVDHHAMVAPVTLGMFLAMLASLRAASRAGSFVWGCVCGLLAALSVGSWIITPPLYFLPVPMTILALRWSGGAARTRRAAWFCLVSAAVLVPVVVFLVADLEARPFSLYQPSWFTVFLFVLVPLFVLPFYYRRLAPAGVAAAALVLVAAAVFVPQLFSPLRQALEVASGNDPSYLMAKESANIFFEGELFTFTIAVSIYTYLILLAPFIWTVFLCRSIRARDYSASKVFGLSFTFLAICLLLLQRRFGEFAAPALALLFGWMLTVGARFFIAFARNAPSKARAVVWAVLLILALGAAVSPLASELLQIPDYDPVAYQRQVLTFGRELKRHTPSAIGPDGKPSYGLNTGWNESHPLLYATGRPVMVSSFGTPEAREGNRKAFRLLLSSDEEAAYRDMVDKRIRFVVTSNFFSQIVAMTRVAGMSKRFMVAATTETEDGYKVNFLPLRPLAESLYMRMFLCDGSGITKLDYRHKPLGHYRLRLESFSKTFLGGAVVPMLKAFEVVTGARLAGAAEPGETVKLKLPLRTNTGRRFMYRSEATAAPDGRFEFVVPYPTEPGESAVVPLGPYLVKVGDEIFEASVTEEDVSEGRAVSLHLRGS